jgi:hypothetical protein
MTNTLNQVNEVGKIYLPANLMLIRYPKLLPKQDKFNKGQYGIIML